MSTILDFELSEAAQRVVAERVESGEFASPKEVIEEGLALLAIKDIEYGQWLRAAVAAGEKDADEGRFVHIDPEFFDRLRNRIMERAAARGGLS